ncbi:MAG: response regulator transcription factor [Deltaproteobacteria bacterium]|nr:response regulator transcription factor [Deltaproteobacteria bacterium]
MSAERILVVEDEKDIRELVRFNLASQGYQVECAESGEAALKALADPPRLVVLDLMLPGVDGLEICRIMRQREETRDLPVLMLTARNSESDIVTGLESGADDYLAKPFSPGVLLARVRALLRRTENRRETAGRASLGRHGLAIDPDRRKVTLNGSPLSLTSGEFDLLVLLSSRPGWVFTRTQIVDSVRGIDHAVTDRSVDVQIAGLRKKLGDSGGIVETVRGVGYRLKE